MRNKLLVLVLAGSLGSGVTAYAHHSFGTTYLTDKMITIEGDLVQFQFRNPHSYVHLMAKDENGEMQRWGVEWGAPNQLGQQNVTRETLKPGDHVLITGHPGRNPSEHRLRMRSISRPKDGWKWGGDFQ